MPRHASFQPSPGARLWALPTKLLLAVVVALVPAAIASGLAPSLLGPATAAAPADRIWATRSGTLTFPMEPVPMCVLVTKFGGYSKVNGSGGHQGIDIGSTEGQRVYAADDGEHQDWHRHD